MIAEVAVTHHCIDRFEERFPGEDLVASLGRAKRISPNKVINLTKTKVRMGTFYLYDDELGVVYPVTGGAAITAIPCDRDTRGTT